MELTFFVSFSYVRVYEFCLATIVTFETRPVECQISVHCDVVSALMLIAVVVTVN